MEETKTNLFLIAPFSFVPQKYKELVKESAGKIFGAVFIIFLLIGIITSIYFSFTLNEVADLVREKCPDFELSNGEFSIQEPFRFEEDGTLFVIDDSITGITEESIKELIRENFYSQIIILGKDSLGMFNNGQIQALELSQLKDYSFSKNALIEQVIPTFKPIASIVIIIFYIIYVGFYYLAALIMSLVTNVLCKAFKKELDEKERFRLTVLAKLPIFIVFSLVGIFTPISVSIWIKAVLVAGFIALILYFYDSDNSIENYTDNTYIEDNNYTDNIQ